LITPALKESQKRRKGPQYQGIPRQRWTYDIEEMIAWLSFNNIQLKSCRKIENTGRKKTNFTKRNLASLTDDYCTADTVDRKVTADVIGALIETAFN